MSNTSTPSANPFQALGSEEAVHTLVRDFYRYMDQLPECKTILDMHNRNLDPMIDKLATFLVGGWAGRGATWKSTIVCTILLTRVLRQLNENIIPIDLYRITAQRHRRRFA